MAEQQGPEQALFANVIFAVIESASLGAADRRRYVDTLEEHGAAYVACDGKRIDHPKKYTHIVSTTADFLGYEACQDHFVHVVKPSWIELCLVKNKQINPRQFSPDPMLFLNDITLTCGDISEGDADAIIGGVLAMGGNYSTPLTRICTHLVALSMDDPKCKIVEEKKLQCKIVLPHWFDDCLRLGKRISERPYLLPSPEILQCHSSDPKTATATDMRGASTMSAGSMPSSLVDPGSPSLQRKSLTVFTEVKVMLAPDLKLSEHLRDALANIISRDGGSVVSTVDACEYYVGQFRDGGNYARALRQGKTIGNLSWLYHIIRVNRFTSPLRKLLHYPLPRTPIPGFDSYRIAVSNYTGEARIYLESLAKAAGATFTKTLRQENTHLLTAHARSDKCDAAREWNIHLVNHLWLEESYARGKEMSLTNTRYTYFPPRTNLGEVVGQTCVDRDALMKELEVLERDMVKHKVVHDESLPNSSHRRSPQKLKTKSPNKSLLSPIKKQRESSPIEAETTRASTAPTLAERSSTTVEHVKPHTPARVLPRINENKENQLETPVSKTTGRSAKSRAAQKIQNLTPDIALFEKEMKRAGGVVHGGRRKSNTELEIAEKVAESGTKRKRDKSETDIRADEEQPQDEEEEQAQPSRRGKKTKHLPPIQHKMLVSGFDRWGDDPNKAQAERAKLRTLGIQVTEHPHEATLLCAPRILRTKKFVASLAAAPSYVVSPEFIDACLLAGTCVDPAKHALIDEETEKKFDLSLKKSLERAKQNKRRLLRGWSIFVTPNVKGGFETYKDIITGNGGDCYLFKGRMGTTVSRRQISDDSKSVASGGEDEEEEDELYLLSGTSAADVELWPKFEALANKENMQPRIVKPDWLLGVAMNQAIVPWSQQWCADSAKP